VTERDRLITLRLSEEEHLRFKAVAEDMGLNISAMIRALVRAQEKEGAATDVRRRRPQQRKSKG
jgi:antitoxin component of RelBE/YafQ-DinJ toxin-antitoxin module